MPWPEHIVLVGAGKVALHLGRQLQRKGLAVIHVHSRTAASAEALARTLECTGSSDLTAIPPRADLYLILVPDGEIVSAVSALQQRVAPESMVMHTSGATPAAVLAPYFPRHGVFYPLQTFSPDRELDFEQVPLCIYTTRAEDHAAVQALAELLVKEVHTVDDEQRAQLHLAAVFVNNFTNHLQHIARQIVEDHDLPAHLLQPLLKETIDKLETLTPTQAQTGPALRGDIVTMKRHLEILEDKPEWAEIYRTLSKAIRG